MRPPGPQSEDLEQDPLFAEAMSGSEMVSDNPRDPASGIEGSTNAYVVRRWRTDAAEQEVVAWFSERMEEAGWTASVYPYITMIDGHFPEHAWRQGDVVIALGFPDPNELNDVDDVGRLLYHTSITYQPED